MLSASVWLNHNRGRSWSCDQCKAEKGLRQKRGNCGGAFKKGLPASQKDEVGLFVPGYRVAPDCGPDFSDLKIRSCPVAGVNKLASIITAFQRHKANLYSINLMYPSPTCAIIEALDVLNYNTEDSKHRAQLRAIEESKHGK